MASGIPALGGTSSNSEEPCSGVSGFGFPATDEAAQAPAPVTTQKYGQADGSGVFP